MATKKCSKCKETKPLEKFCKHDSCRGGRHSQCKSCLAMKANDQRARDPKKRQHRRAYLLRRKYGISSEEYDTMSVKQRGCCAICGQPESVKWKGKVRVLSVDHNHETGQVRALLCHACNNMLGCARDNVGRLRAGIAYLELYDAVD